MLIRDAEVAGARMDLRCSDGVIVERAARITPRRGERELDARGGALLPGLHDRHLHLFSLAAQLNSIPCGPPQIETPAELSATLRHAAPIEGWLRGTGYFESVAGPLDRTRLDEIDRERPLRIQHRGGAMWFLNSPAIEALGLEGGPGATGVVPDGVERDATGRLTGRLFRSDDWLRERLPNSSAPDLSAAGALLARYGVTRVTDATPSNGRDGVALFRAAQQSGALPQRLRLMGDLSLSGLDAERRLEIAEYKILLDDPRLPDFAAIVASIDEAHRARRGVAIHCVTRTEIHFALGAIEAAGAREGDRLEHASIAPTEAIELAQRLGVSIVTQPNFISERGDAYREDVEDRDRPHLYRVRSWLAAGVPLGAGTDAPFGDPDPWRAMQAAVSRKTRTGATLGPEETVSPETALGLFTGRLISSQAGRLCLSGLAVGKPADVCLLDAPWQAARESLSSERVVATLCEGEIAFCRHS